MNSDVGITWGYVSSHTERDGESFRWCVARPLREAETVSGGDTWDLISTLLGVMMVACRGRSIAYYPSIDKWPTIATRKDPPH